MIMNIFEKEPRIHRDVFVAPSAAVIGDVDIGHGSSIWYGSILRGKSLDHIHHACSLELFWSMS
jgi:carbonic anhydrase/acetyltransferase-like protein (isoleucine patch superfamily)